MQDDPVCVAAIKDGKILVTSLWADHSLEAGGPVETDNVSFCTLLSLLFYSISVSKAMNWS